MYRLAITLLLLVAAAPAASEPLDLQTSSGEPIRVELRESERALIVHFWATWCTECVVELPLLASATRSCGARDVRLLVVNVGEEPGVVAEFLERNELELRTLFDREARVWKSLRSHGLPTNLTWTPSGRRIEVGPRDVKTWNEALKSAGCGAEGEAGS